MWQCDGSCLLSSFSSRQYHDDIFSPAVHLKSKPQDGSSFLFILPSLNVNMALKRQQRERERERERACIFEVLVCVCVFFFCWPWVLSIPSLRELALVWIIPNQILFSFSSDKDRRTDSQIRRRKRREFPWGSCRSFVAQWLERATRIRKTLGLIPGGAALCFSSDPAVSSSIFVGAEREKSLIPSLIFF